MTNNNLFSNVQPTNQELYGKNISDILLALSGVSANPYTPGFSVHLNEVGQIVLTVEEDTVEPEPAKPVVKFFWNGVKVDGFLYRAFTGVDDHARDEYPKGTIVITGKNYKRFPAIPGLTALNDSDSMSDYFVNDRIFIEPTSEYYADALQANQKARARELKRKLAYDQKMGRNNWI